MAEPYFILIETATDSCSAALSQGCKIISEKYICTPKAHASKLAPFIEELLHDNSLTIKNISAVGVSEGPGSYTGLRVGVSLAKGICFGAGIPLIGIGTLDVIAQVAIDSNPFNIFSSLQKSLEEDCYIVPMIDAGRMEVYTAIFNSNGERLSEVEAKILDENSFTKELANKKVLFTGNGSEKFKPLVEHNTNALFSENFPHASGLRIRALERYKKQDFEDTAYFQPFYLKDFSAGKPKTLL